MTVKGGSDFKRARDLVLRYGWNSTCFQIVNPGIDHWFGSDGESVVGYVRSKGVRVVAGAPVCAKGSLRVVAKAFESEAEADGETVCYFGAEARLEAVYRDSKDHSRVSLGGQPVWHPARWASIVDAKRSLRAQFNRARNKGIKINEWPVERADNDPSLRACLEAWLATKGLPPLHFVIEPETLERLENRRVFVAEREERVEAFLILSPVPTRSGWLTEQFPHRPGAPNGTVELMMDQAIRKLGEEAFEYVTLGISPLSHRANLGESHNPTWLKFLLAWMRKHGQRFYNFDGLDHFKSKLMPEFWEPVYAISNEPKVSGRTMWAIASAFADNRPFSSGMVRHFERLGGSVRLADPVALIATEADRATVVRTVSGWSGRFDAVASNADVVRTYDMLGHKRAPGASARLKRKRFSPSLFVVHFSTEGSWPEIPHHSILFGPRYGGLLKEIYGGSGLPQDPSIYLHHPTATDPSMAPDGRSTFYALAPVPHLGRASLDWGVEGPRYARRLLEILEQRTMPGLADRLGEVFHFGPADFEQELNSHLGSAFSLEPVLTQSAYFRVHNRDDVIRNLYFVGAGTHPGAGIPGVVGSAKATAGLMLEDLAA